MSDNSSNIEQIEKYLSGQMKPEEQASFEKEMESNADLAMEVRAMLGAKFVGHMQVREQQLQELKDRYDAAPATAGSQSFLQRRLIYAVAAAILILAAVWLIWPSNPDYEQLFTANYEAVPAQVIRDTSNQQRDLRLANIAFNQANYDEAIRLYEQLLLADPSLANQIHLFLGQAYMTNQNFTAALQQFDLAGISSQEAQWFKALTYVRAGDISQAKTQLRAIATDANHFYAEKAQALLDKL